MTAKTSMSRAELELAVRAELVDLAPTTWNARIAADYILRVIDEYARTQRESLERRQLEVAEFFLAGGWESEDSAGWRVARWMATEWHRAVCCDDDHVHEETPWSVARNP